jgi:hypothetical protein
MARKLHALRGQFVYVRRFYVLLPETTDITITQIIGKDEQYVRRGIRLRL